MKKYLGIEFGSTRIKAVAIDENHRSVSSGDYTWASSYENGIWTYDIAEAWSGLKQALGKITNTEDIAALGVSGMMHGYLAFDADWNLLVPFRTWQNTITAPAAAELSALFNYNIPQRWSIAHLYQAMLNREEHLPRLAHITTLAGYIHYMLTGVNAVGICEASGIFPIDSDTMDYDREMTEQFNALAARRGYDIDITQLMPRVLCAGEDAGCITEAGSALTGHLLSPGIPVCPPEGDGGTGMTATNAIAPGTGNVSAGTSVFSMVVLDCPLKNHHEEIDVVTTPTGRPVAMVHCNNCTSDSNAWVSVLGEAAELMGIEADKGDLFGKLYKKSLEGDADCGGVIVCNYLAGEGVTHLNEGRPMVLRRPDSRFNLANFFRATLYSTMVTLKLGMEILESEGVEIKSLTGHGGLFKTPEVGQRYMAAACKAPITCMQTAGEGGPWGMAVLAAYRVRKKENETLENYLLEKVFATVSSTTVNPDPEDVSGFDRYTESFKKLLSAEAKAVEVI